MKRQGGFTLIELVVVIVILGILAVTAAPKFLNLQSDARASSLQGLKGAMAGAAGIVYGKAAIEGKETDATGDKDVDGIKIYQGYPSATTDGIGKAVVGLTEDWSVSPDVTTLGSRTYVAAFKGVSGASNIKATQCFVTYSEVSGAAPTVTIDSKKC
ncbi:type II secretion system protein [Aliivibrio sp. S4TY2]|uniref:type II secretion system protein n=1 Tax=unclassified Aliivibrio TaxID=2645654 RepID=UPI0023799008|nr:MULTISPECIES: type II secretion system protein [unclassified Aliivibrio]MDD9157376.1 type II secretion system protein [Aliivibrio sp. S4TY2]MDD9161258.1 type II secretion system protein [Aliivibrio sp. S4TY1]MDD9165288.1 type II secretion system protein [Aliivibrio sp. S4MY2]MDD9169286.1 type II secretion system protein [Aliivibrio sp. S4MY4]MDD9175570.1 type II secretion system protein [Aliivibrio sp. S3TY1]